MTRVPPLRAFEQRACSSSGSAMIEPTVMRGLRLACGSWKIICMRGRSARSASPLEAGRCPCPRARCGRRSARRAAGWRARSSTCRSRSRRRGRASRPRAMSKLTSSTALIVADLAPEHALCRSGSAWLEHRCAAEHREGGCGLRHGLQVSSIAARCSPVDVPPAGDVMTLADRDQRRVFARGSG